MRALLAVVAIALLAGCLQQRDEGEAAPGGCPAPFLTADMPRSVPTAGGPGPAALQVRVIDESGTSVGNVAVLAWWIATPAPTDPEASITVEYVRVRTSGEGVATVRAPSGVSVEVAAGSGEWTHDGQVQAADGATLELRPLQVTGVVDGAWDMPATLGAMTPQWDPKDLPWADARRLASVERLVLELTWSNGPQGGADFGIAVGHPDGSFTYWNPQPQPTVGSSREVVTVTRGDFEGNGWHEDDELSAGPSISTGGFAVTPIPYTLAWTATFLAPPDIDVCAGSGATSARDVTEWTP